MLIADVLARIGRLGSVDNRRDDIGMELYVCGPLVKYDKEWYGVLCKNHYHGA